MMWFQLVAGALYCVDWEIFVFLAGASGGGKSLEMDILGRTFGGMGHTMKSDVLMGKGTANGEHAQPFMASCKARRLVITS